ncbi:RHS repeat-associated core domain-containing protein [Streptomyces sp. NPDC002550]
MRHDKSVPVTPVVSHYHKPKAMPRYRPSAVSWPSGSAQVALAPDGLRPETAGAKRKTPVRAGSLPVWVSPATAHSTKGRSHAGTTAPHTPSGVRVQVLPRAKATAAGVNGVLLTVNQTDAATTAGAVQLSLGYQNFASAFGADWASRLHLVALPACALTTPHLARCRAQKPLSSVNDGKLGWLRADLALPAGQSQAGHTAASATPHSKAGTSRLRASMAPMTSMTQSSVMVLAATSSSGGGGGDFTATSLQPSSSWQAGGSTDAFTWSYPISLPPVPGDLHPSVSLGYDSQSQDGLTSSTNNQASWIGDGFDYSPGFIERSYQSCHQNPSGATQTWDNCWSSDNTITLSLDGRTTTLVKDDSTGAWHAQNDANERVEYKTGASNGAQNGEYWVVTTPNGTQYYFGQNQLPGYASGNTATNSVWTEPVFATASGQPCYNSTFANSWCQQAYRWNLDYVVDPHQDTVSYFYTTETNYYARDLGTTANTSYIRGGYLNKIMYGQRAGHVYSTSPSAQVLFTVNGRCNTSSSGCATSTLSSSTASQWPDVPYDLNCTNGSSCSVNSPTFWSEYELTGIQTQALVGTTETNVDSFTFAHSFPATGDATTPSLWLSSITRTGQDTSAGGSTSSLSVPPVTLSGTPLSNRVNTTDGYPPITRQRLNTITTETGATISVAYSSAACGSGTPSDPSQNTQLCYPSYWTPSGQTSPIEDWFNKYIVTGVTQQDPTGGGVNDTIATHYTPIGSPAWHYDDNPLTPSNQRTWNQWRGYQGMKVSTGTAPDPVTETDYTYFRGMDGDTLPNNGTRSVSLTDSRGDTAIKDLAQYTGMTLETITYNGWGSGKEVTDTITNPWTSAATATHALTGLPSQKAFLTGESQKLVYTPLASGSTQQTETDYTHDSYGRVTKTDDQGDVSTASDDLCTTTSYADNTSAWILDKEDETSTVSVNCSTTPSLPGDAVSDTRTYYDNSTTFGAAPSIGDATMVQRAISYSGSTPTYSTESTGVDEYGRALTSTNADNHKTTITYAPSTGAEPTSITVTDPMTYATTTTYDALRELPLQKTDPASYVTKEQYDALGRLTAVFKPGISNASLKYSYTLSNSAPSVVSTQNLNNDGSTYRTSETLYDALLRPRETQTATADGGRLVTDTVYDTNGWTAKSTAPYYNGAAPDATLVQAQDGQIPSETGYTYDGAGRKTAATAYALGSQTWQTTYTYGGNFTTTVPPKGGTAKSVLTDARGRTTDMYQYHSGVPADPVNDPASDYSDTHYTYFPDGKRATENDPGGNKWSWTYDLLGNQTSATDPDTGLSKSTYDSAGQLTTITDARGKQTTYAYDNDGRKTAAYNTTGNASASSSNQIGAWTYDTLKKSYPTASTSYQMGTTSPAVTNTVLAYTSMAKPQAVRETLANLPSNESALAPSGGYTTSYTYTLIGNIASQGDPASGGLPAETVAYGYDNYSEPTGMSSSGTTAWDYVQSVGYSEYGQPLQYTMGPSGTWVALWLTYDAQTHAVTETQTTDSGTSQVVDDTTYGHSNTAVSAGAGLIVSTTDKQDGGATTDTQCYTYDYATRLSAAWTATDNCSATPTPGNSGTVGGPNPYWQSWAYDAAGNRDTQTDHDTGGNTANDTTTSYHYPTAGSSSDQPHTLTNTTATGPGASNNTASYTYDASGNTKTISGGATGDQTLTWNDQGKLATDTTSSGTTSYLYDADGNLALRTDPGQATLFLGAANEQIVENTGTQSLTGTRYYTIGGTTTAERSSNGDIQYLIPNPQGTDTLALDYQTLKVTRRQYAPFGTARGTAPSWPGDTGYIGGTPDPTTSLENLGAREYNPASGRFLSPDPLLENTDPNQLGGYDYAGNDPTTGSDPTGAMLPTMDDGGGDSSSSNTDEGDDGSTWLTAENNWVYQGGFDSNGNMVDDNGNPRYGGLNLSDMGNYDYSRGRPAYYGCDSYCKAQKYLAQAEANDKRAYAALEKHLTQPFSAGLVFLGPLPSDCGLDCQSQIVDLMHPQGGADDDGSSGPKGCAKGDDACQEVHWLFGHTYASVSGCMMVCAGATAQQRTVSAGITGGLTFDTMKGATKFLKEWFGASVGFSTATPDDEGRQLGGITVADGLAGFSFSVGQRNSGGYYYTFGWAGGMGIALQGPTTMGGGYTKGEGWSGTW